MASTAPHDDVAVAAASPRRHALRVLGYFLLASAFFVAPSVIGEFLVWGDASQAAWPAKAFIGSRLQAGDLPFWNPLLGAGAPILGDPQNGLFYPTTLLYALLPAHLARGVDLLLHLTLCGVFAFALGRRLSLSRIAAAFAATVYALGGCALVRQGDGTFINALPWLPAAALALQSYRTTHSLHAVVAAAGALGLTLLAGHAPAATNTFIVVGLLGLVFAVADRSWRVPLAAAAALALGAGLGSLQLIPALTASAHLAAAPLAGVHAAAAAPLPPATLLLDMIRPAKGAAVFIGLLPMLLAVIAIARINSVPRPLRSWPFLIAIGVLLMLGDHNPLYRLLREVPLGAALLAADGFFVALLPAALVLALLRVIRLRGLWRALGVLVCGATFAVLLAAFLANFTALFPLASGLRLIDGAYPPSDNAVYVALAAGLLAGGALDLLTGLAPAARQAARSWLRHYGLWLLVGVFLVGASLAAASSPARAVRPLPFELSVAVMTAAALLLLLWRPRWGAPAALALLLVDSWIFGLHGWTGRRPEGLRSSAAGLVALVEDRAREAGGKLFFDPRAAPDPAVRALWPNAPSARGLSSVAVWGRLQPRDYADALQTDSIGTIRPQSPVMRHQLLSLLGARTMLLPEEPYRELASLTLTDEPPDQLVGQLPAPRGRLLGGGVKLPGETLLLRALSPSEPASALVSVPLTAAASYRFVVSASAPEDAPTAPLQVDLYDGEHGYDSPSQQLDIPPEQLRREPREFSQLIATEQAPAHALLRAFTRSRTPIRARVRLLRAEPGTSAVSTSFPLQLDAGSRGPTVLQRRVAIAPGSYYVLLLEAARRGEADLRGALVLDLYSEGYDGDAQQLTVPGERLHRDPRRFTRVIHSGPTPPDEVDLRLINDTSGSLHIARAELQRFRARPGRSRSNPKPVDEPAYQLLDRLGGGALLSNRAALPRAWLARETVPAGEPTATTATIDQIVDIERTVAIEGATGLRKRPRGHAALLPSDDVDQVRVRVDSSGDDGVLVLRDLHWPGWEVTVNGAKTPLLRAHGLLRAAEVPAGRSTVVFRHRPAGLAEGGRRASMALGLCILLVGWQRWRDRRRRTAACDESA